MIEDKNNDIVGRLSFVLEMVGIIKKDFERNKSVHYNYYLEKLNRAETELSSLVSLGLYYKEEDQKKEGDCIE